MEQRKLIPAPLDGKNIATDFLDEFMQDGNVYTHGHYHALIGAPLDSNQPYRCEWSNQSNWLRFTPILLLGNGVTLADIQRLADDFVKFVGQGNDGKLTLTTDVNLTGVWVDFYFIND